MCPWRRTVMCSRSVRASSTRSTVQKVVAVQRNVEADQIGAQQPIQQLRLPWADAEGLRIGPGNMPEDGHARVGPGVLHHPRQQREVIVLHKHHGVFAALHLFEQRIGKPLVHALVALPVGGAEDGPRVRDVAQRPQPFVGKAVVVLRLFFRGKPHPPQRVTRIVRRHAQPVELVHGRLVGIAAAAAPPTPRRRRAAPARSP